MKRVAVLGSTGSIGTNALDVIASHPEALALVGIAARSRIELLDEQIRRYKPQLVGVADQAKAAVLSSRWNGAMRILPGQQGLVELATHPDVDIVVVGTSGPEALVPLLRAIEAGKRIALASKELLVMAGELIMAAVRRHQVCLMPVDSEHAALFQCLQGVPLAQVQQIILTGSGGPLWTLDRAEQERASRAQVLRHPKWQMGPKITVDSATLMNKGLEVIEAHWLFGMPLDRIRVVIHPQALIHAMVELTDGSCLAQMSICDMRLPIQFALSFPERWPTSLPRLRLTELSGLQWCEPDLERFPCLRLALAAAQQGGTACTVLSAANDTAVWAYLREELSFADIPRIVEETVRNHQPILHPTLDEILYTDTWARQAATELVHQRSACGVPDGRVPAVSRGG